MALLDEYRAKFPSLRDLSDVAAVHRIAQVDGEDPRHVALGLGVQLPAQNAGLMGDTWTDVKRGAEKLPSALVAAHDMPYALAGLGRPMGVAAQKVADFTGIHPDRWAEEAQHQYSPERQQSDIEAQQALDNKDSPWYQKAAEYAAHPRTWAGGLAETAPSLLVGGALGKGATSGMAALGHWAPHVGGAVGQGAMMAAQQLADVDPSAPNQQRQAMAAMGQGLTQGALMTGMGGLAAKLGVETASSRLAGGVFAAKLAEKDAVDLLSTDAGQAMTMDAINGARPAAPLNAAQRYAGAAASQGLQGYPMGYAGQVWQNIGEGKDDWTEGANKAGVSSAVQGAAMGPMFNLRNRDFARENYDVLKEHAAPVLQAQAEPRQRLADISQQMQGLTLQQGEGAVPLKYRDLHEAAVPVVDQAELAQAARLADDKQQSDAAARRTAGVAAADLPLQQGVGAVPLAYRSLHEDAAPITDATERAHAGMLNAAAAAYDEAASTHEAASAEHARNADGATAAMGTAQMLLARAQAKLEAMQAQPVRKVGKKNLAAQAGKVSDLTAQVAELAATADQHRGNAITSGTSAEGFRALAGSTRGKAAEILKTQEQQNADSGTVREGLEDGQARGSEGVSATPRAEGDGRKSPEAGSTAKKSKPKPPEASENGRTASQTTKPAEAAGDAKATKPAEAAGDAKAAEIAEALEREGDEKSAAAGMGQTKQVLESATRTKVDSTAKPKGQLSVSHPVLAGIVRTLRSGFQTATGKKEAVKAKEPVVYKPGTGTKDVTGTASKLQYMRNVRDAAFQVRDAYLAYDGRVSNILPQATKTPATGGARAKKPGEHAEQLTALKTRLAAAVDKFVAAAGSRANANAVVAAFKNRIHPEMAGHSPDVAKAADWVRTDLGLSRAWKMSNDGLLDDPCSHTGVSSGDKRNSWEIQKRGAEAEPYEKAATEGAKRNSSPSTPVETGVLGVLARMQATGVTPMERLLGRTLGIALRGQDKLPGIKFDVDPEKGQHASYMPAEDTIHLRKTSSAEEAAHEVLHAALQWLVYTKPNHEAVHMLDKSLQAVLNFPRKELKTENARQVYDILRGLANDKTGVDGRKAAMLELVSYGTTMHDFTEALKQIPSNQDIQFKSLGHRLVDMASRLVQRFLGVSKTVANDVLHATHALLSDSTTSSRAEAFGEAGKGQALKADVVSGPADPLRDPGYDLSGHARKDSFVGQMVRKMLPGLYGENPETMRRIEQFGNGVIDRINEHSPAVGKWLANFNSRINVDHEISAYTDFLKSEKSAPIGATQEFMSQMSRNDPEHLANMLGYMDHLTETSGKPEADKTFGLTEKQQAVARRVQESLADNINNAPQEVRDRMQGLTHGEMMTVIAGAHDTVSRGMNVEADKDIVRGSGAHVDLRREDIVTPGGDNGPLSLGGKFYPIMQGGKEGGKIVGMTHASTAHQALRDMEPGEWIDSSRAYRYDKPKQGVPGSTEKTHSFIPLGDDKVSGQTAKQQAAGLMNTLQHLASANAMRNYVKGLIATKGEHDFLNPETGKVERKGPNNVVFKSLEDIHSMMVERQAQMIEKAGGTADRAQLRKDLRVVKPLEPGEVDARTKERYREWGEWVHVPDSPAWGELAGHYVHGPVMASLNDAMERPQYGPRFLVDATRAFKTAVVGYNPSTWAVNTLGNVVFTHMNNIQYKTVWEAAKMFRHYHGDYSKLTDPQKLIMSDFHKAGAEFGTWTSTEARDIAIDAMLAQTQNHGKGILSDFMNHGVMQKKMVEDGLAKAKELGLKGKEAHEFITSIYAGSDNLFRLAAYMTRYGELQKMGNLRPDQMRKIAGLHAKDVFHDYDIDSRALKWAKGTALPFASFTYAATKRWLSVAKNEPWKIAEVAAMYAIADGVMSSMTGDSDREDARKRARDNKADKTWFGAHQQIRLPGPAGKTLYLDAGRLLPVPFPVVEGQPVGAWGMHWWPTSLSPNGLLMSLAASVTGTNLWTGKPVWKETDSDGEKFQKTMAHLASSFEPGLAKKLVGVPGDGEHGPLGKAGSLGHIPDLPTQIVSAAFSPVSQRDNAEADRSQRIVREKIIPGLYDKEVKALQKQRDHGNITPREYLDKAKELKERKAEKLKEATGEE